MAAQIEQAPLLADLVAAPSFIFYISQERWGCWIWGKYFERSCNRKMSLNGPTLRNNCVTTIFREKSLGPMITSEKFSFSEELLQKKILFLDAAGGCDCDMCEICINFCVAAQFRT